MVINGKMYDVAKRKNISIGQIVIKLYFKNLNQLINIFKKQIYDLINKSYEE